MKHFAAILVIASLLCACTKESPEEPERPGEEPVEPWTPEAEPEISFYSGNVSELNVGEADGELHIILYREADGDTGPQSCLLAMTEGSDFASVGRQADFAEGSRTASVVLSYSPSKMGSEQRTATIGMDGKDKSLSIRFIKSAAEWSDGGAMLLFDGSSFIHTESKYRLGGNKVEWILSWGEHLRHFTVENNIPDVISEGGVAAASAFGKVGQWPGVEAESCFGDDFIALNVCSLSDGGAEFPHTEYFFRQSGRYAVATVCDGWLLPVLAIDAKLLNPAENMWTAPTRIGSDGSVTVFGPYHNGSPVHRVNACSLAETWRISIADGKATVAPQFSGFRNKDVFDFDFMIAAEGRYENGPSKIIFESPLHNCNADGTKSPAANCTWAAKLPTVIEIGAPTDFRHF